MATARRTYRYMGVRPFGASDRDLFFGRAEDIESLGNLILSEKLVVLFGKSGYGKSSLLNAGVLPRFLESGEYAPVIIEVRLGAYVEGQTISPIGATLAKLAEKTPDTREHEVPDTRFIDSFYPDTTNRPLWYHFKKKQKEGAGFLLVFDQFEEFFSYPAAAQKAFKREFAELLYSDLPQHFRKRLQALSAGEKRFLASPMEIKTVFAIRADRISNLDSMKDALPAILHKRYELRSLSPAQAREAIVRPAGICDERFSTPPFEYTEEGLAAMLDALTSPAKRHDNAPVGSGGGVEAFQLQILCEHVENLVRDGKASDRDGNGLLDITSEELPEMANLYENYYRRKLTDLAPAQQRAAQLVLEEGLLAEDPATGEGRRMSVDSRALLVQFASAGLKEDLLRALENTFLIRRELNTVGGFSYEISHDTLVGPVMKARKERIIEENQHKEQRRKTRIVAVVIASLLIAAGAVGFGWWAFRQKAEADRQRLAAETARNQANEKLKEALQEQMMRYQFERKELERKKTVYQKAGDTPLITETAEQVDSIEKLIRKNQLSLDSLNQ